MEQTETDIQPDAVSEGAYETGQNDNASLEPATAQPAELGVTGEDAKVAAEPEPAKEPSNAAAIPAFTNAGHMDGATGFKADGSDAAADGDKQPAEGQAAAVQGSTESDEAAAEGTGQDTNAAVIADMNSSNVQDSPDAAVSKPAQQPAQEVAQHAAAEPASQHSQTPKQEAEAQPAADVAAPASKELDHSTKASPRHKETAAERLTTPTAMRMLQQLQQTQGGKPEWHIATGVTFKSKKLSSDEMSAMVDRLCTPKHDTDNLPPKPHAVKLVFEGNKEVLVPVKESTKEENITYMANLYERCKETRAKTLQSLNEKWLQPLIKARPAAQQHKTKAEAAA